MPTRTARIAAPVVSAVLASSLLAGAAEAVPRIPEPSQGAHDPAITPPRHDIGGRGWQSLDYEYASAGQSFTKGDYPTGLTAKLTVHRPKEGQWRRGDHSLAEMALARPGGRANRPSYIEAGWIRGIRGRGKVRLFVFWWGLKGKPHCYNLQCRGFVRKGKGKRPGTVLKPGSTIKLSWRHKHDRWNLYVNGKRSGYYPDRLWKNKFNRISYAQLFGETVHAGRKGRCIDMGTGHFPRRHKGARVWDISLHGTRTKPNVGKWTVTHPNQYRLERTSKRSFRYGGPGPC